MPKALMLFAAGLGTRMAPLTANRPKPLIPVAGRCLLDHALDQADALPVPLSIQRLTTRSCESRLRVWKRTFSAAVMTGTSATGQVTSESLR